jgi:hypothetical protein
MLTKVEALLLALVESTLKAVVAMALVVVVVAMVEAVEAKLFIGPMFLPRLVNLKSSKFARMVFALFTSTVGLVRGGDLVTSLILPVNMSKGLTTPKVLAIPKATNLL